MSTIHQSQRISLGQLTGLRFRLAAIVGTVATLLVVGEIPAQAQRRYSQLPPLAQNDSGRPVTREQLPPDIMDYPSVSADLDVVHRRSQLIVTKSPVVRSAIADPTIIDIVHYGPNEVSVIGMLMGSTTLTLWFENNPQPLVYLVKVIRDPSLEDQARVDYGKLEKKLALLFPNSKVYLIPLSGKVIVKGQARDAEEASWIISIVQRETINQNGSLAGPQPNANPLFPQTLNANNFGANNIINMLEIPGDFQVMLRCRIVELKRSQLRRAGVDFTALIADGRHVISSTFAGTPATLAGIFENGQVNVAINALHSNGMARILTEPVLTVLSGHPATVLSGGEFAVPTIVGINGVGGQQTYFRGFGSTLVVIPVVLDKDLIRMAIRPEFSRVDSSVTSQGGIPGLNTRRVQTTVQLREGQTIVLAGLISSQQNVEITGIPFLRNIPVIGPLIFQGKKATEDETELLISVSPEIVRPMEPDEVPPYPGHEITAPDDRLLYLKAAIQGAPDTNVYQLAPYGNNSGQGVPIGYGPFNPAPASPLYSPVPTAPYGSGFSPAAGNGPPPAFGSNQGRYAPPQNLGRNDGTGAPTGNPNGNGQIPLNNQNPGMQNGLVPNPSAQNGYPSNLRGLPNAPGRSADNAPLNPEMRVNSISDPAPRGVRTIPQMLRRSRPVTSESTDQMPRDPRRWPVNYSEQSGSGNGAN